MSKLKEAAAWKKQTKNGKDYYSVKITLEDDSFIWANLFEVNKKSDKAPDFATIKEKEKTDDIPF